jgi:hypothetical protein
MPSESKDKKEKKDKKDKGGESESKKDKKEKKDKGEKSEEGKSKDKKEKSSKSKDKDKTKDTKESKSKDKGKEGKDIITAGSTTYRAHVTRDTEGKKMRCWVPEGKQLTENEFVWIEHVDGSTSERYFANKADPNIRKWELPEISSTAGGANAAIGGGGQAGTDAAMKFVEEKHFKERKEFKEKEAKKPVATAARKAVAAAQEKGILTKDEATILAMNVAKEYMSLHRKWDADGEKWVRDNAAEQIALIEDRKKEYATSMMTRQVKADSLSGAITREEDLPIPTSASPNLTFPTSPLLPRASYLRDPYYFRRVNRRNPKREMEAMFEDKLFLQPGAGTVRVLSAVRCKVGSAEKESFACVVRDWAGAFMLVFAEATTMGLLVITSAYPLLEHVDLQRSSEAKGVLFIDDIPSRWPSPTARRCSISWTR